MSSWSPTTPTIRHLRPLVSVGTRTHRAQKRFRPTDATNGAEQPQYDLRQECFFVDPGGNKPAGGASCRDRPGRDGRALCRLKDCGPNGAALGPGNQLLAGCGNPGRSVIIDKTNGNVLADFSNVGGSDEVWYNPGDNRYYLASRPSPEPRNHRRRQPLAGGQRPVRRRRPLGRRRSGKQSHLCANLRPRSSLPEWLHRRVLEPRPREHGEVARLLTRASA